MKITTLLLAATCLWTLPACVGSLEPTSGDDDSGDDGDDDSVPLCTETGRTYLGFGGTPLEADRSIAAAHSDHMRLKPFGALADELLRVTGLVIDASPYKATFGGPPARWFEEPTADANTLYAGFILAFDTCREYTTGADNFSAAPTAEAADIECRAFARRFWSREATDDQASACASYAMATDATETPARRWALTCASVLSSAGFLAY